MPSTKTQVNVVSSPKIFRLLLWISAALTLVFAVATILVITWYVQRQAWFNDATAVEGEVVELIETRRSVDYWNRLFIQDSLFALVVRYRGADGEPRTLRPTVQYYPVPFDVGDRVTLLIPSDEPDQPVLDTWAEKWLGLTLAAGFSVLPLVIFGIFTLVLAVITPAMKRR